MFPCPKRLGLERSAGQQLLEDKALSDQLVRSSTLELKDQRVKDDQRKPLSLQRQTEADVSDCRYDNNSNIFEPVSEDIEKDVKYFHTSGGKTCGESSQQSEKPVSGCNETKTEPPNNESVVRDICNHTRLQLSSLNSQIKEEVKDSGSHDDQNLSCFFCRSAFSSGGLLTRHMSGHTGEKLLTCVICKKTFTLESELVIHMCAGESSQHHQSQCKEHIPASKQLSCSQLSCSQCGENVPRSEDLDLHLKLHTRENVFSCSVCKVCCSDKDSLIQHMRIHTRQTQFTCHVCGKDFTWRRQLTKHMEVHKKRKRVFRCRACGAEFCTYYLLSKHKVVHQSSEIPHSQTEENRDENEAMETAADGEEFGRPEPTKNLNTNTQMQRETKEEALLSLQTEGDELRKQTREAESDLTSVRHEDFQSDTKRDSQLFTSKEDLSQHTAFDTEIQEVKQEDPETPQIKEEEEEAEIPKFTFSPVPLKTEDDEAKPQSLQCHSLRDESNDFLGEPDENEKSSAFSDPDTDDSDFWKQNGKLQSSSNSESDSGRNPSSCSDNKATESLQPESDDSVDSDFFKDYKKPESDLNSVQQETTEKGAKYITDLKPYSCTQCGKAFRYSFYLKIHMKQHFDRYFCSVCGHKSTSSSNLKVHMRTHTGEKPFSCSICGKKYTNKASMLSHMSVHDAERKYSCDECKKSFAWYTELKYHQCVGESSHEQAYVENLNINLKRHTLHS